MRIKGELALKITNAFITAQPSNASYTSDPIEAHDYKFIELAIALSGNTTPVGTLAVQGSIDGTNYTTRYLDANKVYGNGTFSGGTSITVNTASDIVVSIPITNPPPFLRVVWTRSSGGATGDRVNAKWFGRGV